MTCRSQTQEESQEKSKTQSISPRKGNTIRNSLLENASALEKLYYQTKLGQTFLNAINKASEIDDKVEDIVDTYNDDELFTAARKQGGLSVIK